VPAPVRTGTLCTVLAASALLLIGDAFVLHARTISEGLPPLAPVGKLAAISPRAVTRSPAVTPSAAPAPPSALPMSIQIPAVGVDSSLQALYLQPNSELQVPSDTRVAGYWAQGPRPGDLGTSVIDGHVDSFNGPGVFIRLRELHPGAEIRVTRRDGTAASFVLDAIREYPKNKFPDALVYGHSDTAQLHLITCGGVFNHSTGHYLDNVVAFAHLRQGAPSAPAPSPSGGASS